MSDENLTPWQKENKKYQALQKEKEKAENQAAEEKVVALNRVFASEDDDEVKEPNDDLHHSMLESLPKLKKEKRIQLLKKLLPLIIFFMIAFPVTIYFLSPFSKLAVIKVVGNSHETTQEIVKTTKLKYGESLLIERKKLPKIDGLLKNNFKRIASATTTYQFPNTFTIDVKEKAELAYIQDDKGLKIVLADGTILDDPVEKQDAGYPVIKSFKSMKQIKKLVKNYNELTPELQKKIKLIELTPTKANQDFVTLSMDDGNQVKITLDDFKDKLKYYPNVAKQMTEKGIVDMEAGIYSYPFPS
ncbi:MAG: cell division protein FtsQ/DivIB [Streptococcaceae bacterium]|nr:cell division protein FtsQ/DivIB [Streptococcaceae bacterium]